MATVEQANKINADIKRWVGLTAKERAFEVLEWALHNDIDSGSVTANPFAAAMGFQRYSNQGPSDYLDMLQSIVAYLDNR